MRHFPMTFTAVRQAGLPVVCLSACLVASTMAQAASPMRTGHQAPFAYETVAENAETVSLIAGLMGIERDLMLGQLFLQDGLVSAEGSHFTHPRHDNFPSIKDGLAQAGAPDLEPLLIALETATEGDAVNTAYLAVVDGVAKAKQALTPSDADILGAVIQTAESASGLIDASGTTEVVAYQECWGLLMVARGQLDHLSKSDDPAIKGAAGTMIQSFDDVVLALPDPGASAPVALDPALVQGLIRTLKGSLNAT